MKRIFSKLLLMVLLFAFITVGCNRNENILPNQENIENSENQNKTESDDDNEDDDDDDKDDKDDDDD